MYPSLPFGPLSLPTTPVLAIIAFWLALETAARFGKRLRLNGDDVWNLGLVALLAGLIVARLWNVIQFWHVYSAEPMLILSLRPSGFVWLPGMIAAVIVAYAWMLRKAMDPIRVAAALSVGGIVAASVLNVSAHLTGGVVGTPSTGPLAVWYYGQQVHPVGIYRAAGFIVVVIMLWLTQRADRPLRTLWLAGFGFSLVHLIFDGWRRRNWFGPFRLPQLLALVGSVVFAPLLARGRRAGGATGHGAGARCDDVRRSGRPGGCPGRWRWSRGGRR
ncbi:MAG: prolipoprotein diacylglyceryl transferase [Caldilineaceae bacterium]